MRVPIIAANWKMNTNIEQAVELVKEMRDRLNKVDSVEKVLCPPFISLAAVKELVAGSSVKIGAQNMHFEEEGAYTGEVSPMMLKDLCEYVVLGHSERRQYFGETDEVINKKVKAALRASLNPILCIGEKLEENEQGRTAEVVTRQIKAALAEVISPLGLVVAYEPVWAIGTGKAASGEGANATIWFIRQLLAQLYGEEIAQAIRIQYGGSVNSANVVEFITQPEIDGALVGGASLKAGEFTSIVEQTATAKKA
jgi:triosephosphate isomerase